MNFKNDKINGKMKLHSAKDMTSTNEEEMNLLTHPNVLLVFKDRNDLTLGSRITKEVTSK